MWGECKKVHKKYIESVDTFINTKSEPRVTDREKKKKVLAIFGASDKIYFRHEKSTRIAVQMLDSFFVEAVVKSDCRPITSDSHSTMRNNDYCKNHDARLL